MKTFSRLKSVGILVIIFSVFSCSEPERRDGDWDDNIKLSQKEAELSAEEDAIVITTQGEWWWISHISLNDSLVEIGDINTTTDNFVIDHPEFRIERKNKTEIHIEMTKNDTNTKRTLVIGLQAGNYFDAIRIIQAGN